MNLTVFYNKYNTLKFLNEKISRKSKSIDPAEAEKLTSKIGDHLKDFGLNSELVFSKLTVKLKEKTIKLLNSLDKNLDLLEHTSAIDNLRKNICDFQSSLNNLEIQTEKIRHPEIELKLAVFCDIDIQDWNGAITQSMIKAFKEELPFVTTRSLLQGSGLKQSLDLVVFSKKVMIQKAAIENESFWDIYQLCTPNNGNEFILFLPKAFLSDKAGEEKLKALDFNTDGLLKKVAAIDLFSEPAGQNDSKAFLHLFSQNSKIQKMFLFDGHGGSGSVAGFSGEDYKNIIHSLERQKCKGIMIISCSSGGKSSLQALSTGVDRAHKYSIDSSPLSYPIIVFSIGDFPAYGPSSRMKDLLDGFQDCIQKNSHGPEKAKKFLEAGIISDTDYSKIYFPSAQGIPGVFKPVCENDKGHSLTHLEIKKSKVEIRESKVKLKDAETGITVNDKKFLYISPMISDVPIVFKDTDPILVSMTPGTGYHFLQSLQINSDPEDFLNKTIDWHKKSELNVRKAFFIKTLKGKTSQFDDVVLTMDPIGGFFAYRLGDLYFCCDKNGIKPITAIQHALIVKSAVILASPSSEAVKTSSQGYENKALFKSVLNSELFQKTNHPNLRDFISLLDSWNNSKTTDAEVIKFAKDKLSRTEIEDFALLWLVCDPESKIAQQLIREGKISPNIKNAWGHTLLFLLHLEKFPAHRELINQELDCNQLSRGHSHLHLAVSDECVELVKTMLKQPGVDVNLKDSKGTPPIFYAINNTNLEIFNLLKEAGASFNEVTERGTTLLNLAILTKQWDLCEELLTIHKVDPNQGKPSALNLAIEQNADDLIPKLIKAGAKPFTEDSSGFIPFIQAILGGKVELVKSLVQEKECSFNIQDISKLSPLAAALWSENLEIIKALYEKGTNLYTLPGLNDGSTLRFLAQKLELKGRTDLLRELFKTNFYFFERFMSEMPDLVIKWIKSGIIDLHCPTLTNTSIFFEMLRNNSEDKYKEILPLCFTKGMDPNQKDLNGNETILQCAIRYEAISIVRSLLEAGADATLVDNYYRPMKYILKNFGWNFVVELIKKDQISLQEPVLKEIFKYLSSNDLHRCEELLEIAKTKGVDFNFLLGTAFHPYNIDNPYDIDKLKILLKAGADLTKWTKPQKLFKNSEVLTSLIEDNLLDPKQKLHTGQSIFYEIGKRAIADDEYLKALHSCLTREVEINEKDFYKDTLLDIALYKMNFSVAKLLMDSGLKVSDCCYPDQKIRSILTSEDRGLIRLIVEKDQVDLMQLWSDEYLIFYDLCKALIAEESDEQLFQKHLKEKNIDFKKNPEMASELLERAFYNEDVPMVKFLLKFGIAVTTSDILFKNSEILTSLIQDNLLDPKQKLQTGQSIFYEVGKKAIGDDRYLKALHFCLTKEVDINEKDSYEETLLGHTLHKRNFSIAKLLMDSGFKVSDCRYPDQKVRNILTSEDRNLIRLIIEKDQIDLMQLCSDANLTFCDLCNVLIAEESDEQLFQKYFKKKNIDFNKNPEIALKLLNTAYYDKNIKLLKFLLKLGTKISELPRMEYMVNGIKELNDDELLGLLSGN
jgi:ankyrin repeat protein